jgi:hypothetical protein
VADSGDRGRSQNGVVGVAGSESRYPTNNLARSSGPVGVPHSARARCGYPQLLLNNPNSL